MTDEDFSDVLRVHVHGTFLCAQEAALRMRDQGTGGAIVNTVSAAHFGNFGQTNYAGSKGAIASMTYTWAGELARYGIRVNAISPAGTTRMSATAKIGGKERRRCPFIDPDAERRRSSPGCAATRPAGSPARSSAPARDRVVILEQPRYGTGMFKPGGWSVEDLRKSFKGVLRHAARAVRPDEDAVPVLRPA